MAFKRAIISAILGAVFLCIGSVSAKDKKIAEKYSSKELRNYVIAALDKSKVDLECMRDYVFSEVEEWINKMDIINKKGKMKIDPYFFPSFRKEYVWFLRENILVRSPTLVDGVAVLPSVKTAAEEMWLKREKKNGEHKSVLDYFFDFQSGFADSIYKYAFVANALKRQKSFYFNFSEGHYSYVGEKKYEGCKVIEVKYEPDNVRVGSVHLVLSLIPEEHQIVKMVIGGGVNHHGQEILIDEISMAGLTMIQIDGKVWLPKKYSIVFFDKKIKASYYYTREYHSFAKTKVNTKITFDETDTEGEK
jgi:hypothetical protein